MRLLFDQNISFRILKMLSENFAESSTVKSEGLIDKSDFEIWTFAKQNNFIVVSQDNDFYDILHLKGAPPKLIILRIGNTTTTKIAQLLDQVYLDLVDFDQNPEINCLELFSAKFV